MTTITITDLDLSAGFYVKGIALNDHTFLAVTPFQQLRTFTRDPEVLQVNSKRGADDPDIVGERVMHDLIQRALSGSKKSNVPNYQRYIAAVVTGGKPGVLPPMHLWTNQVLEVVISGQIAYLLVPNGEFVLAIDGETQLSAHHALARAASVDANTKAAHQKWPLAAVIHHGIGVDIARQYFHDLNVLAVRPNASLGLSMNTQDPVMTITTEVEVHSDVLRGRVERQSRQLPRKSEKIVTLTNLRQMVITTAKGINGIQFGARPMPTDGLDMDELREVATNWVGTYFDEFRAEVTDRDATIAGAGSVLAAIGALGQPLLTTPDEERATLTRQLLDDLRRVDWSKGEHWNGIAGGYTANGIFSVKGTKEVAYSVYNALADPHSPAYARVRHLNTSLPTAEPELSSAAAGRRSTDVVAVADLPWGMDETGV